MAALLFLITFAGFVRAELNLYDSPRKLPNRVIYNTQNKKFKLSDFKGSFVVAVFWSRHCAPCLREMEGLNYFSNKTKDDGIKVVIISPAGEWADVDEQNRLLEKLKASDLENYVDEKGDLAGDLGIFTSPHTVLVNKEGEEVGRIRGAVEWDDEDVIEYIYKIKAKNN